MLNLRTLIIGTPRPLPYEDVTVPEWADNTVRVITLPAALKDQWEASRSDGKTGKQSYDNIRAAFLCRVLCDPVSGERIFTDADAEELGKQSAKVIGRLFDIAAKLNGMTKDDLEELAGN